MDAQLATPSTRVAVVVLLILVGAMVLWGVRRSSRARPAPMTWERAFVHAPVGLAVVDADARIVHANRSLAALAGRGADELAGAAFASLLDPAGRALFGEVLAGAVGDPESAWTGEMALRRDDGRLAWVLVGISPMPRGPVPAGSSAQVIVQVTDLSAQRAAQQQLRHQAMHDRLTGLPGRELFLERLNAALDGRRRGRGGVVAVLFCDLDGFKEVNDRRGHAYGDRLLAITARRLAGALRASEFVARWGGDEFVVLCQGLERAEEVTAIATRLIAACSETVVDGDATTSISMSVGIAVPTPGERDAHGLIAAADTAMYAAKRRGSGCWVLAGRDRALPSA